MLTGFTNTFELFAISDNLGFLKISATETSKRSSCAEATSRIADIESPPNLMKLSSTPTDDSDIFKTEHTILRIFFSISVLACFLFILLVSRYCATVSWLRFCTRLRRRFRSSFPAAVQGIFLTGINTDGTMYGGNAPTKLFSADLHTSLRVLSIGSKIVSVAATSTDAG
jgi:hypothetical protein